MRILVIVENGVRLKLNIVDTPGYGDQINNEGCWEPIVRYVRSTPTFPSSSAFSVMTLIRAVIRVLRLIDQGSILHLLEERIDGST